MKSIFLFILLLISVKPLLSQPDDKQAIRKTIQTLFDGMYEGDSAKVSDQFTKEITKATVYRSKNNEPLLSQESSLDGFLKAVGTPHAQKWTEEIWDVQIQIDGDFAQAWCGYAFYLDHTFSHCGVDAFHLHKTKQGWKIFHLADTRKKEGCKIPEEIMSKHK